MIEINNGSLYMFGPCGIPSLIEDNLTGTAEVEISTNEVAPLHIDLHKSAEFSCDNVYINTGLLDMMTVQTLSNTFTVEWDIKAMVQARWHKNSRIRKKWLKRYGMKSDTVHVVGDAKTLEIDDLAEYQLQIENMRHVLRPDQKRRGLKIAW